MPTSVCPGRSLRFGPSGSYWQSSRTDLQLSLSPRMDTRACGLRESGPATSGPVQVRTGCHRRQRRPSSAAPSRFVSPATNHQSLLQIRVRAGIPQLHRRVDTTLCGDRRQAVGHQPSSAHRVRETGARVKVFSYRHPSYRQHADTLTTNCYPGSYLRTRNAWSSGQRRRYTLTAPAVHGRRGWFPRCRIQFYLHHPCAKTKHPESMTRHHESSPARRRHHFRNERVLIARRSDNGCDAGYAQFPRAAGLKNCRQGRTTTVCRSLRHA